jgi:hypothetical protein
MRKTKLKKQSNRALRRIETRLDKDYQDFFRELCEKYNITSEYSGKKMEVCHHPILKSKSANLRYNPINFVPITNGEHSQIHHFSPGNNEIMNRVYIKRGIKWAKALEKLQIPSVMKDLLYYAKYRDQLEEMKLHREELVNNYRKLGYFKL